MPIEHHDLNHEFPQFRERIHHLKINNNHFRKLFEEYHSLTRSIENMEKEIIPVASYIEDIAKVRRLALKDQLHSMLQTTV